MTTVVAFKPAVDPVRNKFRDIEARMDAAHSTHLGYPYNLVGRAPAPEALGGYLINNLGDPYAGSHYGSEVCDLEREAVGWLMDLWQCGDHGAFLGLGRRERDRGKFLGALSWPRGVSRCDAAL